MKKKEVFGVISLYLHPAELCLCVVTPERNFKRFKVKAANNYVIVTGTAAIGHIILYIFLKYCVKMDLEYRQMLHTVHG